MNVYDALKEPVEAMSPGERGLLHLYLVVGAQEDDDATLENMPPEWRGAWKALGEMPEERWSKFFNYIGKDFTYRDAAWKLTKAFSQGWGGLVKTPEDYSYLEILDESIKLLAKVWKVPNSPNPLFVGDGKRTPMEKIRKREEWIVARALEAAWEKLSPQERKKVAELVEKTLREKGVDSKIASESSALLLQGGLTLLRSAMGFEFHIVLAQVANAIARVMLGRGLSLAANAALQRLAATIFGPIGWLISGVLLMDLLGKLINPREWKKVLPAVIMVAMKRLSLEA